MNWNLYQISQVKRLTAESVQLDLVPQDNNQSLYTFDAGQFITIEQEVGGELLRRSYSICSAPGSDVLSVGIKAIPEGRFSNFANTELKPGDVLKVAEPQGAFVNKMQGADGKSFVFFAAGSGITPILSMIRATLSASENAEVCLFFGNKKIKTIMFLEEIEALKNEFLDRIQIYHILSQQIQDTEMFQGRIDSEKLDTWMNVFNIKNADGYFMCGPETMVVDLRSALISKGISNEAIHFELFNTESGEQARKQRREAQVEDDGSSKSIEVVLHGKQFNMQFGTEDDNLLDLALEQGADLPYACKGGVCCTCKAKVTSGTYEMYVNYGLEPDEIEKGFVLACQCYPTSESLVLNFDEV